MQNKLEKNEAQKKERENKVEKVDEGLQQTPAAVSNDLTRILQQEVEKLQATHKDMKESYEEQL